MLTVGTHGVYEWLVTNELFDLLENCPEVAIGKYIAITSIDGSQLVPSEEEMAAGWESRGRIAYSPRILDMKDVPQDEWDEWYIFANRCNLGTSHLGDNPFEVPQDPGHINVFVNHCFALHDPEMSDLGYLFWEQMARIRPESYLSNNDYLNFATMNKNLFEQVLGTIKVLGRRPRFARD